jgi:hypothetical protein
MTLRMSCGGSRRNKTTQSRSRSRARPGEGRPRLIGLPTEHVTKAGYYVSGPMGKVHDIDEQFIKDAGLPYNPPKTHADVDVERAKKIAQAFDQMKHDSEDPRVKASYDAMIRETLAQYRATKKAGTKLFRVELRLRTQEAGHDAIIDAFYRPLCSMRPNTRVSSTDVKPSPSRPQPKCFSRGCIVANPSA